MRRLLHFLRLLARVTLVSYAQVLLSGRARAGLFFVCAAFLTNPFVGLAGLLATLVANLAGYRASPERIRWELGLSGYNAVMLGLAIGYALPVRWWVLLVAAAAGGLSALITDLAHRRIARFSLPVLGLPFLAVAWPVLALVAPFKLTGLKPSLNLLPEPATGLLTTFLHDMGSVYFSPSILSGLLVLAGLLVASRISAAIGLAGALAGAALAVCARFPLH